MHKERRIAGIYGILPADIEDQDLLRRAESALKGGVQLLQLRDKKLGYKRKLKRAKALSDLCHTYKAKCFINDSVNLALDAGADGVHLGRQDLTSLVQLRCDIGDDLIVGVSCQADATFATHVLREGADYVSFGAVFPTTTKADASPIGLPRLAKARQMFPEANICAIGGITLEALPVVKEAGADAAAVVSELFEAEDIEATARALVAAWNNA